MENDEDVFGKELSNEAIKVVRLWQKVKAEKDSNKQTEMATEFAEALLDIVEPGHKGDHYDPRGQKLVELILHGTGSEFYFGSGSSGNRISFRDHLADPNGGLNDIESPDGEVGFMFFPDPGKSHGEEEFRNFVRHFGSFRVDLSRQLS